MTPEERLQRIEELLARIAEEHIELEAAQKNTEQSLNRFIEQTTARFADVAEQLTNSRILIDRLIERELGGGD
jgi:hypothetical protein